MNVVAHRAKADSVERSLARCSAADYETIIEGCMLAGTHWFNVALHRVGLMATDADAMHAEFLSVGQRRKIAIVLADALAGLDTIESLRTSHVRGDLAGGEAAAQRALACLAQLKHSAESPVSPLP
ncbi:MAG: hypothetical protein ABI724_06235 [Betaproteobacteria bacterium]